MEELKFKNETTNIDSLRKKVLTDKNEYSNWETFKSLLLNMVSICDGYFWCSQANTAKSFQDLLYRISKSKNTEVIGGSKKIIIDEIKNGIFNFKQLKFTPSLPEPPTLVISNLSMIETSEVLKLNEYRCYDIDLSSYYNGKGVLFNYKDCQYILNISWY